MHARQSSAHSTYSTGYMRMLLSSLISGEEEDSVGTRKILCGGNTWNKWSPRLISPLQIGSPDTEMIQIPFNTNKWWRFHRFPNCSDMHNIHIVCVCACAYTHTLPGILHVLFKCFTSQNPSNILSPWASRFSLKCSLKACVGPQWKIPLALLMLVLVSNWLNFSLL